MSVAFQRFNSMQEAESLREAVKRKLAMDYYNTPSAFGDLTHGPYLQAARTGLVIEELYEESSSIEVHHRCARARDRIRTYVHATLSAAEGSCGSRFALCTLPSYDIANLSTNT